MKIIGHRGAKGLIAENTLASLQKAVVLGVDGIEFDVRVTKDDVPVIWHDMDMLGDSGTVMNIAGNTYGQLKGHKSDMATLDEVLKSFYGKTVLYMEVKTDEPLEPVFKVLEKYGTKKVSIGSFHYDILKAVRERYPSMNLFVNDQWSGVRATKRAKKLNTKCIDISHRWLWSGFIRAMKQGGFELYAYNLDSPAKAKKWAKAGLAGVITNYPDRFTR